MKIQATNITINVRDLDKSISFYHSIGFQLKERWGSHYAQMVLPDIIIGLHPTDEKNMSENSGNVSIGFIADEFELVQSEMESLNISFKERKEAGGRFLHFNDPDGTALYFIEARR